MNEEYIKKLEESNKLLEETLSKYKDRYGELNPIVAFQNPSEDVVFGSLPLAGGVAQMNGNNVATFSGNVVASSFSIKNYTDDTITITRENIVTKDYVNDVFSESLKKLSKEIQVISTILNKKPKASKYVRYIRVIMKKIKRKFK